MFTSYKRLTYTYGKCQWRISWLFLPITASLSERWLKKRLLLFNQGNNYTLVLFSQSELSGAKSTLQGETVGVCSYYKRGGQPSYDLPAAHLRFTGIFLPSHYKQQTSLRPTVGLQGNFPPPTNKHSSELRPTVVKIHVMVTYLVIHYIM